MQPQLLVDGLPALLLQQQQQLGTAAVQLLPPLGGLGLLAQQPAMACLPGPAYPLPVGGLGMQLPIVGSSVDQSGGGEIGQEAANRAARRQKRAHMRA